MYRADSLCLLSDHQVLHTRKTLSKRKMRTREPLDDVIKYEKPRALNQAIKIILENNVKTKGEIVNEIRLSSNDIEAFCGLKEGFLDENNNKNNNIITFKIGRASSRK